MKKPELKEWDPTYLDLKEDEYLLKLDDNRYNRPNNPFLIPVGFLTKLTQKKLVPTNFNNWPNGSYKDEKDKIYLFKEIPMRGWVFNGFRIGKSQNWVRMVHPYGFIVEIYLDNFRQILLNQELNGGEIRGKYKWKESKLIKEVYTDEL